MVKKKKKKRTIKNFFTKNFWRNGVMDSMDEFIKDNDNIFNNEDFGERQVEKEFKRIIYGQA